MLIGALGVVLEKAGVERALPPAVEAVAQVAELAELVELVVVVA